MSTLTDAPSDNHGFGLLARAIPDAVLALDAGGRVVFADPRAAALFGGAVLGGAFVDLLAPEDRGAVRDVGGGLAVGVWDVRPAAGGGWLSVALHAVDPTDASVDELAGGTVVLARPVPAGRAEDRTDLFRLAFDAANNLIVVADARAPDVPIVLANEHFLKATGYTREEVVGRNCRFLQTRADGTLDDDQPGLTALREALAAGEPTRVVLRNYRKSGELFYNELYISPVHDASGRLVHFVGVQNDITERVRAEQVASERAQMVGSFFEGMPLPMGVLEQPDGRLVHRAVNRAAAVLFARRPRWWGPRSARSTCPSTSRGAGRTRWTGPQRARRRSRRRTRGARQVRRHASSGSPSAPCPPRRGCSPTSARTSPTPGDPSASAGSSRRRSTAPPRRSW